MNIKGAIFDLDGTLIDSLGFWKRLWEKLGETYSNNPAFLPNLDMQEAVRTVTFVDAGKMLYDTFGFGSGPDEIYHMMTEFCTEFYKKEAALKPGVKELLEHLKSKGIKMCVASASMPDLIRTIFDPDVFIAAETYMGTSRQDTWVFEDSPVALQTASKAGFQTVGVFDENNFGADEIASISTEYIGKGDSFLRLLEKIK